MWTLGRPVKRILVLALGWGFIALGVLGLFLPVLQGVLFILIGLYVLSRESRMARRWLDWLRARFPEVDQRLARFKERLQPRRGS